jgi:hypothetical protein
MSIKRRQFLGVLSAGAIGDVVAQEPLSTPKSPLVRTPLVLMAPRADGIEAIWAVTRLSRGLLEWETENGPSGVVGADAYGFVPQSESVLRVRLSGLKPGTKYRVRSRTTAADNEETAVSEWKTFRTLNPAAAETRFVMWNDTHLHDATIRALDEATPAADFLLWNGDTCNDWTKDELLIPALLHPGERDITATRPLLLSWGNHDVRGAHAFRSGPVAVICLHTGEDKPDDHPSFKGRVAFDALRAEQAEWLAETIRQPELRDAPYRIVFCHIPLRWKNERLPDYARGGYDYFSARSRAAWHASLVEWKAQVILSGHTHQAAWLPPTAEFPYGQLVGGGPKQNQATWTEGVADAKQLRIQVTDLNGKVLEKMALDPLV